MYERDIYQHNIFLNTVRNVYKYFIQIAVFVHYCVRDTHTYLEYICMELMENVGNKIYGNK